MCGKQYIHGIWQLCPFQSRPILHTCKMWRVHSLSVLINYKSKCQKCHTFKFRGILRQTSFIWLASLEQIFETYKCLFLTMKYTYCIKPLFWVPLFRQSMSSTCCKIASMFRDAKIWLPCIEYVLYSKRGLNSWKCHVKICLGRAIGATWK